MYIHVLIGSSEQTVLTVYRIAGNFQRAKFSRIAAKGKFADKIFTGPRLKISIFL